MYRKTDYKDIPAYIEGCYNQIFLPDDVFIFFSAHITSRIESRNYTYMQDRIKNTFPSGNSL